MPTSAAKKASLRRDGYSIQPWSEINNRADMPMRFIQMWFIPSEGDLAPSIEQKAVEGKERTNRLLPLVSNEHKDARSIHSGAVVANGNRIPVLGAAQVTGAMRLQRSTDGEAELLLVDVLH
jgi:hypothetical protein